MKSILQSLTSPLATGSSAVAFLLAKFPLDYVDAILPRLSQLIGCVLGVVTIYNLVSKRDTKAILARLDDGEKHFERLDKQMKEIRNEVCSRERETFTADI